MKLSYLQKSKKNRQFYLASSIFLVLFSLSLASCTDKKKEFESLRTQVNSTLKYSLLEKEDRLQIIENSLDSNEKLIATYHVSINDEKRKKNGLGFAYPFS